MTFPKLNIGFQLAYYFQTSKTMKEYGFIVLI